MAKSIFSSSKAHLIPKEVGKSLSILKTVASKLRGNLKVVSNQWEDTCFTLWIPVAITQRLATGHDAARQQITKKERRKNPLNKMIEK
jgi:hypothetical protein